MYHTKEKTTVLRFLMGDQVARVAMSTSKPLHVWPIYTSFAGPISRAIMANLAEERRATALTARISSTAYLWAQKFMRSSAM